MNQTPQQAQQVHQAERQLERLLLFCDAVFAIAITLLVLEIKVPEVHHAGEHELLAALMALLPKALGYVVSFLVIGSYWAKHHKLFSWVRGWDDKLVWGNLILLLCVAFIPFPTAFFSEYLAFQTPLILYAASLALVGLAGYGLCRSILKRPGLLAPTVSRIEVVWLGRSMLGAPLMCLIAIGLSFVDLAYARISLLIIPVVSALLARKVRQVQQSSAQAEQVVPKKA